MTEARAAVKKIEIDRQSIAPTMRAMGYSPITADSRPDALTKNPTYLKAKNELLESLKTVNPKIVDDVAKQLNAGVTCDKTITAYVLGGDGETSGRTEYVERPDHPTRLKYCETVAKLFGWMSDKADAGVQVFNPSQFFLLIQQSESERPDIVDVGDGVDGGAVAA